jgi:acetyl-CoA carboxylase biotin carboxyl carrier protein
MRRGMQIDADAIRQLAKLLEETGLAEIEIAERDSRVRVARAQPPAVIAAPQLPAATVVAVPAPVPAGGLQAGDLPAADLAVVADHPGALKSPMVGVAWLRPDPGGKPFIQPGERVAEGQTVLLIEAMKTFNQIKAHRAGTISRILVADGSPVEYAEVLMLIE